MGIEEEIDQYRERYKNIKASRKRYWTKWWKMYFIVLAVIIPIQLLWLYPVIKFW